MVRIRELNGTMTTCFECEKPFPVEFDEQISWIEIRRCTDIGARGFFLCPDCAKAQFQRVRHVSLWERFQLFIAKTRHFVFGMTGK
jgi:hypothetical protein